MRRIDNAFDRLTMPKDCQQRIESQLRQQVKKGYAPYRAKRQGWAMGAVAVCLLLAAGCMLLTPRGSSDARQTEALQGMETENWEFSSQGLDFLEKMCVVMPEWDSSTMSGDAYWPQFLFQSFATARQNSFSKDELNSYHPTAQTIAGEIHYDGKVVVPLETAQNYLRMTIGYELTAQQAKTLPEDGQLTYQDGCFYIEPQSYPVGYAFLGYCYSGLDITVCQDGMYTRVSIDRLVDEDAFGGDVFWLRREDNPIGYVICRRETYQVAEKMADAMALELNRISWDFANAYYSGYRPTGMILSDFWPGDWEVYADAPVGDIATAIREQPLEATPGAIAVVDVSAFADTQRKELLAGLRLQLVMEADGWKVAGMTEAPAFDETTEATDAGMEYLRQMCVNYAAYMTNWDENTEKDTHFWQQFITASFTFSQVEGNTAKTIIGELEYQDGRVLVPLAELRAHTNLVLGCGLTKAEAEALPEEEYLSYADGIFRVAVSQHSIDRVLTRETLEYEGTEDATVTFELYSGQGNGMETVCFRLCSAENEYGFNIVGVQTNSEMLHGELLRQQLADVAEDFATAYFADDWQTMLGLLSSSMTLSSVTPPERYSDPGKPVIGEISVYNASLGGTPLATVRFRETADADTISYLELELTQQEDGWKVSAYSVKK